MKPSTTYDLKEDIQQEIMTIPVHVTKVHMQIWNMVVVCQGTHLCDATQLHSDRVI
jgi:hypothetical protein